MKYTKLILIPLSLILACSENTNEEPALSSELFRKPIIAESLQIYRNNKSIDKVADYLKANYQIDFYKEGEKISLLNSYFNYSKKTHLGARINEEISFADIGGLLESAGFTSSTITYYYVASISSLFENGTFTTQAVYDGMVDLRLQIENDYTVSAWEKYGISTVGTIIENNFFQIVDIVDQENNASTRSGSRTLSWNWGAIWRVTRSIVLTSTVGAFIGVVTYGPYGALVGGIIMSIASNADAVFNGYCHFAMQCDGGWRQECISGDCAPYNP